MQNIFAEMFEASKIKVPQKCGEGVTLMEPNHLSCIANDLQIAGAKPVRFGGLRMSLINRIEFLKKT